MDDGRRPSRESAPGIGSAPAVGRGGESAMDEDDEPQAWAWTDFLAKMM